jgi:uncharacterized protein DUF4440
MDDLQEQLTGIERKLWTNDPGLYEDSLVEEALLVFPETGVITRDAAVEAIRVENAEGRRWAEVHFHDVRTLRVSGEVAVLVYRVTARWEHEEAAISALASSTYVYRQGAWKLILHQQSPL